MKNQIIFITGGTSGIGKALVQQLHKNNTVITCSRTQEKLDALKKEFPSIEAIKMNIGNQAEVLFAKSFIQNKYGRLDVLINNAGIGTYVDLNVNEQEIDFSDIHVNLIGTIQTTQALLPLIRKSNTPNITIVSSILAKIPVHNIPLYSASKAALHSYSLSLRKTVTDVQITEVLPPLVDTPLTETVDTDRKMDPKDVATAIINGIKNKKQEVYPGDAKVANVMSKVYFSKIESLLNVA